MNALAWLVTVLLLVPPLLVVAAVMVLFAVAFLCHDGSRRVRTAFVCPVRNLPVIADFLMRPGDARPPAVVRCSAFARPERITCAKACRDHAAASWTPPLGVFARWALTSDGVVGGRAPVSAPAPAGQATA
jgi:hypothetical protein